MSKFKLKAQVTLTICTEIEADSLEEAIKEASFREIAQNNDPFYSEEETWILQDIDGTPQNIQEDEI